jgi:hypothetical protein
MKSMEKLGKKEFLRAQKRALETYLRKDPLYGSAWKKSIATWGPEFLGMRIQEDVSKLVTLLKAKRQDRDALLDTLTDIQVYATFGVMYFEPRKSSP